MTTIIDVPAEGFIKKRYEELEPTRNKYRDRMREYALLTLPYIMPQTEENTDSNEFQNDYNTEGAKLVNSLANKYVENLFPAGRSFIKLGILPEDVEVQEQQGNSKADIESQFAAAERAHRQKFVSIAARPVLLDLMKHLIIGGNGLIYLPKGGNLMNYAIDEFVVLRSLDGTVLEIITEDKKALWSLDPELRKAVIAALGIEDTAEMQQTIVSMFTYIRRDPENPDTWYADQAVENFSVGEQNTYKTDNLRWIPVGWNRTRREIYYRGLVEEHFGSLWTLSILSEALAVGCVTLSDIKYLVRPGSLVDVQEMNDSGSGSYHYGEADDINAISTDRSRDIIMIKDVIELYRRHLGEVFMYAPSTMRDAERVTAEETRLRATELENAHGGVYSSLAESLQKPLAKLLFEEMGIAGLEEKGVEIDITTGIDALSRGNENNKINHWLADLANAAAIPDEPRARLRWEDFMKVTAAGRDIDFTKFVMTEAEVEAKTAEAAQQQAALDAQVRSAGPAPQQQAPQQY